MWMSQNRKLLSEAFEKKNNWKGLYKAPKAEPEQQCRNWFCDRMKEPTARWNNFNDCNLRKQKLELKNYMAVLKQKSDECSKWISWGTIFHKALKHNWEYHRATLPSEQDSIKYEYEQTMHIESPDSEEKQPQQQRTVIKLVESWYLG